MKFALKIVALCFGSIYFLAYGWWDRSYLSFVEQLYWLTPGFGLFVMAAVPFRVLSSNAGTKWGTTLLCAVGTSKLLQGIIESLSSPIEPDTAAVILRSIILGIFIVGLQIIWNPHRMQ